MSQLERRWVSLVLSLLLVFSVIAGTAEEAEDPQELYNQAIDAYAKQDYETAAEYLLKSAEMGFAEGQNALAVLYFYGTGVEQSVEKAMEYWDLAGEQGNDMAFVNIASLYHQGMGVEQSYEKAAEYYRKAADLGNTLAMEWLAVLHEDGWGVEQSWEKAAEYLQKAVDLDSSSARVMLGALYRRGEGVEQDYAKAKELWERAAEQGESWAVADLGAMYENGWGVEQSYETAVKYYQNAMDMGNAYAQYRMGDLYLNGRGVEQSREKAEELFRASAEQGLEEAIQALQELATGGDYGLVQTEGIVIPDCTKDIGREYEIPESEAMDFVKNIRAGWNLGNTFDAKDDGPGIPGRDYETYWSGAKTTRGLIQAIHQAGFNLLRIPVSWHNHLMDDRYTIDPAWLLRVEEVARWALDEGMYVIINIHHDDSMDYLYPDSGHYDQSEMYVTAIWAQVAEKFAEYDERLIFESMNEPRLVGSPYEWNPNTKVPEVLDAVDCINRLNQAFVDTVRASGGKNAERFLMIPGYCGGYGGAYISQFELPDDDRLIVEVHAYTPYSYALDTTNPDSSFDLEQDTAKMEEITAFMDNLYERHIEDGVPVIIDEFGAIQKNAADLQDRVNYAAFYTAQAAARGIPVVWWDNANITGGGERFGLIDRNKLEWVWPDIALALLRNSAARGE